MEIGFVNQKTFQRFGRVRAAAKIARKRPILFNFGGENLVHLLDVVLEVVGVLEQLFAARIKTPENARLGGVVSGHVPLEAHVAFEVFPTQQTRVQNGGVLEGGVARRPSNVQPHMQLKLLPQKSQETRRAWKCRSLCSFNSQEVEKMRSHLPWANLILPGIGVECNSRCSCRYFEVVRCSPHSWHS
jgi:hypothetical protein